MTASTPSQTDVFVLDTSQATRQGSRVAWLSGRSKIDWLISSAIPAAEAKAVMAAKSGFEA
jgi:hypothetical protein